MVVNFFKLETNGDLTFGCSACKHHKPSKEFIDIARMYHAANDVDRELSACRAANVDFAMCQLTGEYCEHEREGGFLSAFFGGRCGADGRFFEPK